MLLFVMRSGLVRERVISDSVHLLPENSANWSLPYFHTHSKTLQQFLNEYSSGQLENAG